MKNMNVEIKQKEKKYTYSKKSVDHSMSTAFLQDDKKSFRTNIKVLVER